MASLDDLVSAISAEAYFDYRLPRAMANVEAQPTVQRGRSLEGSGYEDARAAASRWACPALTDTLSGKAGQAHPSPARPEQYERRNDQACGRQSQCALLEYDIEFVCYLRDETSDVLEEAVLVRRSTHRRNGCSSVVDIGGDDAGTREGRSASSLGVGGLPAKPDVFLHALSGQVHQLLGHSIRDLVDDRLPLVVSRLASFPANRALQHQVHLSLQFETQVSARFEVVVLIRPTFGESSARSEE